MVADGARNERDAADPASARSPAPVSPLPALRAETAVCPRCKQETPAPVDFCSRCGFSFRETRSFEPAATAGGNLVGQVINGKYRVLSVLGEGGFGVVYKVELLLFDTANIFALKLLHPSLSQDKHFRRRFLREAGLAMALIHENTIQIREFGQSEDGQLFFTMDYCAGEPLKAVISREKFLNVNRAIHITRQVLSVMKLAHSRGIIHRDLKPENIFLEKDAEGRDFVKVGDFGLAKSFGPPDLRRGLRGAAPSEDISRGAILGTPRYMSPEQALGRDDLDDRSDLYSIGVMLYEMLYGTVPAERMTPEGGSVELRTPLPQVGHEVPSAVWDIVRTALETARESRYQSADEFLAALATLPEYTSAYAESYRRPRRSFSGGFWGYAAVALLSFAGAVFLTRGAGGLSFRAWMRSGGETRPVSYPQAAPALVAKNPTASQASGGVGTAPDDAVPALSRRVSAYMVLARGDELRYQTYRAGVPDREIVYRIVEELEPGRFRVVVTPGDRELVWVVDDETNTFHWEFPLPDDKTGAMTQVGRKLCLELPARNDVRTKIGEPAELVLPKDAKFKFSAYAGCLPIESSDRGRVRFEYYHEGNGLVGLEVYESREQALKAAAERPPPIHALYLVEHRRARQ